MERKGFRLDSVNRSVVVCVVVDLQIGGYGGVEFGGAPPQRRYAVTAPHVLLLMVLLVLLMAAAAATVVTTDSAYVMVGR